MEILFLSPIFSAAIPHTFELSQVMRQTNENFLRVFADLRLGKCSLSTKSFISALSRDLPNEVKYVATHIFNRKVIESLEGEIFSFEAICENKSLNMKWPGQCHLQLKVNCKVILVWNKSESLRNGSMGVFAGVRGKMLLVSFPEVGTVEIEQQTWIKSNLYGQKVGSISQYPIIPAYAITCHKSQGLTLLAAVIHCSREYVPGLMYVAISRVKTPDVLQVLNFYPEQLLPPSPEVLNMCKTSSYRDPVEDLSCCCKKILNKDTFFSITDTSAECVRESEDNEFNFPDGVDEKSVQNSFEEENYVPLELTSTDVFDQLTQNKCCIATASSETVEECVKQLTSFKYTETNLTKFMEENNNVVAQMLKEENCSQL